MKTACEIVGCAEVDRVLSECQPVALIDYPNLAHSTRKMLRALDGYWAVYDGANGAGGFGFSEETWWTAFEKYRDRVEGQLEKRPG